MDSTPWWQRLISACGIVVLLTLAWLLSEQRRKVPWRIVFWGLGLQFAMAVFVLRTPVGAWLFQALNDGVLKLLDTARQGIVFVFGGYAEREFTIAFNVLPILIFFSSLSALLYHFGILQRFVGAMAWIMRRTMRTSGPETLSAAANVFLGMTEAPLLIRPYIAAMSRSELAAVMIGGFATVAGSVLGAYVGMLREAFPQIAGHLIAASVMNAPAGLVIAKLLVPPKAEAQQIGTQATEDSTYVNAVDAAAQGAGEGIKLALNVAAMLLAFVALVALIDVLLALPTAAWTQLTGHPTPAWTLRRIGAYLLWPLAWLLGIAPADCGTIATLLSEKVVLNELIAYRHLGQLLEQGAKLQERSVVIVSYALCGFANFGSIAIQIGGIGVMAPSRRQELAQLGLRAMLGGLLATCMSAALAGVLL